MLRAATTLGGELMSSKLGSSRQRSVDPGTGRSYCGFSWVVFESGDGFSVTLAGLWFAAVKFQLWIILKWFWSFSSYLHPNLSCSQSSGGADCGCSCGNNRAGGSDGVDTLISLWGRTILATSFSRTFCVTVKVLPVSSGTVQKTGSGERMMTICSGDFTRVGSGGDFTICSMTSGAMWGPSTEFSSTKSTRKVHRLESALVSLTTLVKYSSNLIKGTFTYYIITVNLFFQHESFDKENLWDKLKVNDFVEIF